MSVNFRENLKVIPTRQDDEKTRKVEAYRSFLSETMPGYIEFMEAVNSMINELEQKGIIGKTRLKTRVKSINSALTNTDEKTLDDVFGFEIVAENEKEKEILMVIIHNLFVEKYVRQKNHNKSNGYFAHHSTGGVKIELDGTESKSFEKHILDAQTNELKPEYRDLPIKEQKKFSKNEIFGKKPRYPVLRQEILENGKLDSRLQENLEWALTFINQYLNKNPELRKNIPIVEMQFKTIEVEQEAKYGRAQHVQYKKVNEDKIVKAYFDRKLVRGVDFPFEFIRNNDGDLEIEHTSETLVNMWPFINDAVTKYHQIHAYPVANYDMFFAKVFPDIEPYVQKNLSKEPSIPVDGCNSEMAWGILKNKIINNSFILPDANEMQRTGPIYK